MIEFLLDTIAFDLLVSEPAELPKKSLDIMTNPKHTLFFKHCKYLGAKYSGCAGQNHV
jgi:hypothetical protein